QAEQVLEQDQPKALQLALAALNTAGTEQARVALAHAFPTLFITIGGAGKIGHAGLSPDGELIFTTSVYEPIGDALLWNALKGQVVQRFKIEHSKSVSLARFSADGRFVFTAGPVDPKLGLPSQLLS